MKYCSKCENKLIPGLRYCFQCGTEIKVGEVNKTSKGNDDKVSCKNEVRDKKCRMKSRLDTRLFDIINS